MQNRYVGDVGDFAKYALLRRLAGTSCDEPIRIGIIWCRHPDENHNSDGRHVSYLQGPEFAKLDTELITALRKIVKSRRRSISAVVEAAILPNRPSTMMLWRAYRKAFRQRRMIAYFTALAGWKTAST